MLTWTASLVLFLVVKWLRFLWSHRNGPKWKRGEKESVRKEWSQKGIRPKADFRLVSGNLNFRSGNEPKNICRSVSYFFRLDSVLLLGLFTVSFGPIPSFFCQFYNIFLFVNRNKEKSGRNNVETGRKYEETGRKKMETNRKMLWIGPKETVNRPNNKTESNWRK